MCKKQLLSIVALFLCTVISCQKTIDRSFENVTLKPTMRNVCPVSNHLNEADILHYIGLSKPQSKSSDEDFSVTPYIVDGDTVMFVVNYSSGWEILSADARTPLLLAKSESGRLSLDTDNPEGLWISLMAADMKRVMESSDDELTFVTGIEKCSKTGNQGATIIVTAVHQNR